LANLRENTFSLPEANEVIRLGQKLVVRA
jgi:hypothetical protein